MGSTALKQKYNPVIIDPCQNIIHSMIPLSLIQITGQEDILRIFKNVWFNRFARQEKITDEILVDAITRADKGLIDVNVSRNLVSDWERGKRKPGGPALKLLNVVQKHGLSAIA